MKITHRKLKALIRDESMARKEYRHLGLLNLSRDENKHRLFLKKLLRKS